MDNDLLTKELKLITNTNTKFFIPSYQRGYRWDTRQVEDLLDDLFEFLNTENKGKYCLQPIVVKMGENEKWEVIDGQQRLTTIYIILTRLKKSISSIKPYSIEYETRDNTEDFISQLDGSLDNTNMDFYHISNAYKVIDKWINNKFQNELEVSIETDLFSTLMKDVEIIWYQINDETNPIDIFTRLNVGKIPLTSSELVKAMFLSSNNLSFGEGEYSQNEIYRKQLEVAGAWDRIEYSLREEAFWGFLNEDNSSYPTRIDFVLDMISNAKKAHADDQYYLFRHFYKELNDLKRDEDFLKELNRKNNSIIDNKWDEIRAAHRTLREWYSNHKYYHLIGYLIHNGTKASEIYKQYKTSTKTDFIEFLIRSIRVTVSSSSLTALKYGSNNKEIHRVLVLFNVISTMNIRDSNIRFPFNKLNDKKITWSLEHIHAQNSQNLKKSDYSNWLLDHKKALIRKNESENRDLIARIDVMLQQDSTTSSNSIDETTFESIFNEVIDVFTDKDDKETELHDISNMALLDKDSNASLNNSVFEVKRHTVLDLERKGAFIPISTRNVFLKYYTDSPEHLSYWTSLDREGYLSKIESTMEPYLKNEKDEQD
jgi:hypothetical protein